MKIFETLMMLALVAILLFGCTQSGSNPQGGTSNPVPSGQNPGSTTPPPTTPPAGGSVGQVKEFSIKAKQWEFIPGTITVNKGDTVRFKLLSTDVPHGFMLPDFGIDKRLEPGQEVDVTFSADKTGTFTFFCNVPCGTGHRDMKGTLVVN